MSLAYHLLYAQKCRSTHHKIAMDSLQLLRSAERERWHDLFLYYVDWYLEGAKAPDDKFKDFRNHVLHVKDNFWGGACTTARTWYRKTLELFRRRDWPAAVYSVGVLSHYFTDPFQPFHTGQTEAEGVVHRAEEWSICKAYDELRRMIDHNGGYPEFPIPDQDDWLEEMIRRGAIAGNEHYDVCIEHYNIDLGVKNPPAGLDDEIRERISKQIALATAGFAQVIDRLIIDSCASADAVPVLVTLALSTAQAPLQAAKDFVNNRAERIVVGEMYAEFKATGKVVNTLPEDDRTVRKAHAAEVLEVPLFLLNAEKVKPPGAKHGTIEPRAKVVAAKKAPRQYALNGSVLPQSATSAAAAPSDTIRRYDPPSPVLPPAYIAPPLKPAPLLASATKSSPSSQPFMVGAKSVSVGPSKPEVKSDLKTQSLTISMPPVPPVVPPQLPKAELDERTLKIKPSSPPLRDPMADLPKSGVEPLVKSGSSRLTPPPVPVPEPKPAVPPAPVTPPVTSTAPTTTPEAAPKPEEKRSLLRSLFSRSPATTTSPTATEAATGSAATAVSTAAPPATAPATATSAATSSKNLKFHLDVDDDLEAAPSIGPKTAKRFEAFGVKSVRDFLKLDPAATAAKLNSKHITPEVIKDWQAQAKLAAAIPNLRGHDAQILVGCGLRDAKEVAAATVGDLDAFVQEFVASGEGQRVLRGAPKPDAREVADWIAWAKSARAISA